MSKSNHEQHTKFMRLYWNLSRNMSYIWKEIFARRFPGSQSDILFLLGRYGRKRMSEIADSLLLTPGAVTTASDKLITNGYIARFRDEKDRRVVYLEMTDKGRDTLTELQNEGRKAMKSVFSHLSESELDLLIKIFEQASVNVKNIQKECKE